MWGWARSRLLAGRAAPRRAPAVPCLRGLTVGRRCHAELPRRAQRGVRSGAKRHFLALEHHGWSLPAAVPGSASEEAPVPSRPFPSCPTGGGARPRRRGGEHRHPGLFKERGSRARESQSSRAGSPSG